MSENDKKAGFFALINALIKAQSSIKHATKDGVNPYFKSGYATLEQVITAVKKPLNDNGIYFQQESHENEVGACVETTFWGHGASLSTGKVTIPADRNDAQSFGSALTYAKRYSLSMACGIGHQADDDANSATFEKPTNGNSKPVKKPAVKPAQKKAPVVEKEESKKEAPATDSKPKSEQKEIVAELVEPASYAKIKDEDGAMEVADRLVEMAKAASSVKELMSLAEGNAPAKKVLEDDWPDVHSVVVKAYEIKWDSLANEEKEKTDG
jgi:hypothetical protein|tara:strand:+ start:4318 stop:5121 length:804 start_codon:yes stop_codon:yes gene_type:complete